MTGWGISAGSSRTAEPPEGLGLPTVTPAVQTGDSDSFDAGGHAWQALRKEPGTFAAATTRAAYAKFPTIYEVAHPRLSRG